MSIAMPETTTDIDMSILSDLDFDSSHRCEWKQGCEKEPQWFVQCAECGSPETICTPHIIELKAAIVEYDFVFRFDRTCGHEVTASDCPIVPMA